MTKTTPASSSDKSPTLSLSVPTSWAELTNTQLLYILRLLAEGVPTERVEVYAFMRFSGLYVIKSEEDGVVLVRKGSRAYRLSEKDITIGAMVMDFINEPPSIPQRADKWRGVEAVNAELHGVLFGEYLQLENFMQRYLQQPEDDLIAQMAHILYPGMSVRETSKTFRYMIIHWMTGLKMLFARLYHDLYKPSPTDDGLPDLREVMLAQIRALTSGDVTKEHGVLNVDTWTALAELNAKAREARELERLYKK